MTDGQLEHWSNSEGPGIGIIVPAMLQRTSRRMAACLGRAAPARAGRGNHIFQSAGSDSENGDRSRAEGARAAGAS